MIKSILKIILLKYLPIAASKEAADRNILPRLAIGDTVSRRENIFTIFFTGDGRHNLLITKKKRKKQIKWRFDIKTHTLILLIKKHGASSFCSLVDQIRSTNISSTSFICVCVRDFKLKPTPILVLMINIAQNILCCCCFFFLLLV